MFPPAVGTTELTAYCPLSVVPTRLYTSFLNGTAIHSTRLYLVASVSMDSDFYSHSSDYADSKHRAKHERSRWWWWWAPSAIDRLLASLIQRWIVCTADQCICRPASNRGCAGTIDAQNLLRRSTYSGEYTREDREKATRARLRRRGYAHCETRRHSPDVGMAKVNAT
jgi:hypothetical protein